MKNVTRGASSLKRRISPATVIASLALFFSLGGAGMAATGYRITSIWQIAPKVRHELKSGGPRGATGAIGAVGQPGPRGATGPQGQVGPQGAPGGIASFQTVIQRNVPVGTQDATVIVPCPSGMVATGGGFSASPDIAVHASIPEGDTWHVVASNSNPDAGEFLSVYAVCAEVASPMTN